MWIAFIDSQNIKCLVTFHNLESGYVFAVNILPGKLDHFRLFILNWPNMLGQAPCWHNRSTLRRKWHRSLFYLINAFDTTPTPNPPNLHPSPPVFSFRQPVNTAVRRKLSPRRRSILPPAHHASCNIILPGFDQGQGNERGSRISNGKRRDLNNAKDCGPAFFSPSFGKDFCNPIRVQTIIASPPPADQSGAICGLVWPSSLLSISLSLLTRSPGTPE